jgi:hypothetical protein
MRPPNINRADCHTHTLIFDNMTTDKMTGVNVRAASTTLRQPLWSIIGFNRITSSNDRRSNKSGHQQDDSGAGQNETGKLRCITHKRLQKFGNQDQGAEEHEAHHEHH